MGKIVFNVYLSKDGRVGVGGGGGLTNGVKDIDGVVVGVVRFM